MSKQKDTSDHVRKEVNGRSDLLCIFPTVMHLAVADFLCESKGDQRTMVDGATKGLTFRRTRQEAL